MAFEIVHNASDTLTLVCKECHATLATWQAVNPELEELNMLAEEHLNACHPGDAASPGTKGIMLRHALPGDTRLV